MAHYCELIALLTGDAVKLSYVISCNAHMAAA